MFVVMCYCLLMRVVNCCLLLCCYQLLCDVMCYYVL